MSAKRKALVRKLERLAVVVVLADAILYFGLVAGLGSRVSAAQADRDALYSRVRNEQMRLMRLQGFQSRLPEAQEQLAEFEKDRVPSRRQGFSKAARLVRNVASKSDVLLSGVAYKLDSKDSEPFERLVISMTADGPYSNLVSFAHGLETAEDFLIVRDFSFRPGASGELALSIEAEMYLAR